MPTSLVRDACTTAEVVVALGSEAARDLSERVARDAGGEGRGGGEGSEPEADEDLEQLLLLELEGLSSGSAELLVAASLDAQLFDALDDDDRSALGAALEAAGAVVRRGLRDERNRQRRAAAAEDKSLRATLTLALAAAGALGDEGDWARQWLSVHPMARPGADAAA